MSAAEKATYPLFLFIPLLGSIFALMPFAIDTYLPAMPIIAEEMNTDMRMVQLSMSVFLAGYSVGLFFFGPMTDIIGRRPILLLGLSGFTATTLLVAFTDSITEFLILRFVQAFIGAAGTVPVAGYVRLIYGEKMVKGMSYITMLMMLAPMIAPSVGVVLMNLNGWQLIFIAMAVYAFCLVLISAAVLPKIPLTKSEDSKFSLFFRAYAIVLGEKSIRVYIFMVGLTAMGFFGYLTGISYVYIEIYQIKQSLFGLLFAINGGLFVFVSFINSRLVGRLGSPKLIRLGVMVSLTGVTVLLSANLLQAHVYWTAAALAVFLSANLLIAINVDSQIILTFSKQTGTASGVIGMLRFGFGALTGPVLALLHDGTALPFCFLMVCLSAGIAILSRLAPEVAAK